MGYVKNYANIHCDDSVPERHVLTFEETETLKFRGIEFPVQVLCHKLYLDQFSRYTHWHKRCSDPRHVHKKVIN